MKLKWHGAVLELEARLKELGWVSSLCEFRLIGGSLWQCALDDSAICNFWANTGTVFFQGKNGDKYNELWSKCESKSWSLSDLDKESPAQADEPTEDRILELMQANTEMGDRVVAAYLRKRIPSHAESIINLYSEEPPF